VTPQRGRPPAGKPRQLGAALLMAMLTVALVVTLAATALWQQWRGVEIESSERDRLQAAWVLHGALDWARLILREDARTGGPDHLGEPWSVALSESRLSTFLAIDSSAGDTADAVFLSGRITDMQARLNVMNLVASGRPSEPDVLAFTRLFELLELDPTELDTLVKQLVLALQRGPDAESGAVAPLLPRRLEQVAWLGASAATLQALAPHVTVLPARTVLNLNTASPEAIAASVPGLDLAEARRMVSERERAPFRTLAEAARSLATSPATLAAAHFGVASGFFEVRGRLRMERSVVEERSLVRRNGMNVVTLWRERVALDPHAAPVATP